MCVFIVHCAIFSSIYIYKNKLSVCVCLSSDVMFSTDEIKDRDIGTQMTTGTPAHREYK